MTMDLVFMVLDKGGPGAKKIPQLVKVHVVQISFEARFLEHIL